MRVGQIKSWWGFIITFLIVLGIMIFLEIIAFNHSFRLDFTPAEIYVLSDQTIKILKTLDKDIQFTVFYQQGSRSYHDDFFGRFSRCTSHIRYRLIDLDRNPAQAKLHGITTYGQTIAECDGKKIMISTPTEERIINTLIGMTRQLKSEIYFTTGHGEKELKREYHALSNALKVEGWKVGTTNLVDEGGVPSGASVLVVGGAQDDFFDQELRTIDKYIQESGKVIFLLEPFINLPNVEKFLEKYQVSLGDDIIVDEENMLFGGDCLAPFIPYFARGPIANSLKSAALFPTACSVEIKNGSVKGIEVEYLAKSSTKSWTKNKMEDVKRGKIDFQENIDHKGPISVAVVVKVAVGESGKKGADGTIVCFGDSDFVSDEFIEMLANKDLFLNTVEWLIWDKELISIRPKKYQYPFHHMTKKQGQWAFWIFIVIVPSIFLIIGFSVSIYRKRKG